MIHNRLACLLVASVMFFSCDAHAGQFYDGNRLYEVCSKDGPVSQSVCLGYVAGAMDMLDMIGISAGILACIPQGIIMGQAKDIIVKYLKDNPEERQRLASDIVFSTIRHIYPCPSR